MRCLALVWSLAAGLGAPLAALADETVDICHGYGCLVQSRVIFGEAELDELGRMLKAAVDPKNERELLADVIGRLYAIGGQQSDIRHDRGGNYADAGRPGRMDCIDHSTSTTRLLQMLERRGYLTRHRVRDAEPRYLLGLLANHWSAVIEEIEDRGDGEPARFVVDSWFVNNGEPAVILPLADWKKGAGPDV